MNRRTVLQSAGALGAVALAGCLEGAGERIQESFQGVVPVEIHNESERNYDLRLEAFERETDRQTYDEGYTVTAGETVGPPHLEASEQTLRVRTFEDNTETDRKEVSITPETSLVLIWLYDDDFEIEVDRGGDGDATDTAEGTADGSSNQTSDSDGD